MTGATRRWLEAIVFVLLFTPGLIARHLRRGARRRADDSARRLGFRRLPGETNRQLARRIGIITNIRRFR